MHRNSSVCKTRNLVLLGAARAVSGRYHVDTSSHAYRVGWTAEYGVMEALHFEHENMAESLHTRTHTSGFTNSSCTTLLPLSRHQTRGMPMLFTIKTQMTIRTHGGVCAPQGRPSYQPHTAHSRPHHIHSFRHTKRLQNETYARHNLKNSTAACSTIRKWKTLQKTSLDNHTQNTLPPPKRHPSPPINGLPASAPP